MSQMRVLIVIGLALALSPQTPATAPEFQNGLAQPVFAGQRIIRHNVWVEVPALDTDRDGVLDRIRVQISRPEATERGTKLPVILMASPYSGGTRPYPQHDINVPLFVPGVAPAPPPPDPPPPMSGQSYVGSEPPIRDINTGGYAAYFLPRSFIVADANSLGTYSHSISWASRTIFHAFSLARARKYPSRRVRICFDLPT